MNKSFRSIWNACKQAYVAAAETVSACGKSSASSQAAAALSAVLSGLLSMSAHAQNAPPPNTLPIGGQVSVGQASIQSSGAAMRIQQSTDRAAINWQTFNVGSSAQVQFVQPSSNSVTLNRVMSADPSQIFGRITANGQVILTNPSGVYFSPSARVDVGGLTATTHSITDANFMAGNLRFERNGSSASVVNEGELKANLGGYIALLAPDVRNQGAIIAQAGTVALASGEVVDLHFDSNNRLTSIRVEASQIQALVDNRLAVQAPGGLVIISAQSMDRLVGGVIKNSGAIEATGLQQQGGRMVLSASHGVQNTGTLNVSHAQGQGGSVSLQAEHIDLQAGSRIDATGNTGGGTVLLGGNWQGSADPLLPATGQTDRAATTVNLAAGAVIDANAARSGDGGTVVLWSDIQKFGGQTVFAGQILAQGGPSGGQGGRVETSGHTLRVAETARVNTSAQKGTTGQWLLDPIDFTISAGAGSQTTSGIGADTLVGNLLTTNVEIATNATSAGNGDITVSAAVTQAAPNSLTLTAHRDIRVNAPLSVGGGIALNADGNINLNANLTSTLSGAPILAKATGNITSNSSRTFQTNNGNLVLWSDSDANASGFIAIGDANTFNTANGSTSTGLSGGGKIVLAGGADTGANGGTASDGIADGFASSTVGNGLLLGSSTANLTRMYSGGGDILIRGSSSAADGFADNNMGLLQKGLFTADSGKGAISIAGNSTNWYGLNFGYPTNADDGISRLSLVSDKAAGTAISITGQSSATHGVVFNFNNPKEVLATGGGDLLVTGTGAGSGYGVFVSNTSLLASSGAITLNGGVKGIIFAGVGGSELGKFTSGVTSSSSNINLIGDVVTVSTATAVDTTGTLTVQPFGTSFGSALSWPITNLTLGSGVSGLTLGKAGNTADITVGSATSIAGPINIYGGNINLNANLSSTLSGAAILAKAIGNIVQAAGVDVTTNSGSVTYWADSDANSQGNISLLAGSAGNTTSVATGGGNITMGGGSNIASGYAYGYGNGFVTEHGINIDHYSTLNAGTGAVTLRGATTAALDDWIIGIRVNGTAASVSGGNITFVGDASAAISQNNKGSWGTAIVNGGSVTGSGTINISGTGGGNTASGKNVGVYIMNPVTGTGSGAMTITGTGGAGTGSDNDGIFLTVASRMIVRPFYK